MPKCLAIELNNSSCKFLQFKYLPDFVSNKIISIFKKSLISWLRIHRGFTKKSAKIPLIIEIERLIHKTKIGHWSTFVPFSSKEIKKLANGSNSGNFGEANLKTPINVDKNPKNMLKSETIQNRN